MNGRVAVIVITALMAFAALYTLFGCGKTKPEAFYPHQLYSRVDGSRDPDAGVDRFDRHVYPISARFSKHAAGAYGLPGSVSERRNIPGTKVRTGNNGVLFDDGLVSSENPVTYPDGTQVINYPPTFTVGENGVIITLKRCIKKPDETDFKCITVVKTPQEDGTIVTTAKDDNGNDVVIDEEKGIPEEWTEHPLPPGWEEPIEGNVPVSGGGEGEGDPATPGGGGDTATPGGEGDPATGDPATGGEGDPTTPGGGGDEGDEGTTPDPFPGNPDPGLPDSDGCYLWAAFDDKITINNRVFNRYNNAKPCAYKELRTFDPTQCTAACAEDDGCHGVVFDTTGNCQLYETDGKPNRFSSEIGFVTHRKVGERSGTDIFENSDSTKCIQFQEVEAQPLPSGKGVAVFQDHEPCAFVPIGFDGSGLIDANYCIGSEAGLCGDGVSKNTIHINNPGNTTACVAMCENTTGCEGVMVRSVDNNAGSSATCQMFRQDADMPRSVMPVQGSHTVYVKAVPGIEMSMMGGRRTGDVFSDIVVSADRAHMKVWDQYDADAHIEKLVHDGFVPGKDYTLMLHGTGCHDTNMLSLDSNSAAIEGIDIRLPGADGPSQANRIVGYTFKFAQTAFSPGNSASLYEVLSMKSSDMRIVPYVAGPDGLGRLTKRFDNVTVTTNPGYHATVTKMVKGNYVFDLDCRQKKEGKPAVDAALWSHGFIKFAGFNRMALPDQSTVTAADFGMNLSFLSFKKDGDTFSWSPSGTLEQVQWTGESILEGMDVPDKDAEFTSEPYIILGIGRSVEDVHPLYKIIINPVQAADDQEDVTGYMLLKSLADNKCVIGTHAQTEAAKTLNEAERIATEAEEQQAAQQDNPDDGAAVSPSKDLKYRLADGEEIMKIEFPNGDIQTIVKSDANSPVQVQHPMETMTIHWDASVQIRAYPTATEPTGFNDPEGFDLSKATLENMGITVRYIDGENDATFKGTRALDSRAGSASDYVSPNTPGAGIKYVWFVLDTNANAPPADNDNALEGIDPAILEGVSELFENAGDMGDIDLNALLGAGGGVEAAEGADVTMETFVTENIETILDNPETTNLSVADDASPNMLKIESCGGGGAIDSFKLTDSPYGKRLHLKDTDKCLGVIDGAMTASLVSCSDDASLWYQMTNPDGSFTLEHKKTGKFAVDDGSGNIHLADTQTDAANQKWRMSRFLSETIGEPVVLQNMHEYACIDFEPSVDQQYKMSKCVGDLSQQFVVEEVPGTTNLRVRNVMGVGQCIGINDNDKLVALDCDRRGSLWTRETIPEENGRFALINRSSGKILDYDFSSSKSLYGYDAPAYDNAGAVAAGKFSQQWRVMKLSQARDSDSYLGADKYKLKKNEEIAKLHIAPTFVETIPVSSSNGTVAVDNSGGNAATVYFDARYVCKVWSVEEQPRDFDAPNGKILVGTNMGDGRMKANVPVDSTWICLRSASKCEKYIRETWPNDPDMTDADLARFTCEQEQDYMDTKRGTKCGDFRILCEEPKTCQDYLNQTWNGSTAYDQMMRDPDQAVVRCKGKTDEKCKLALDWCDLGGLQCEDYLVAKYGDKDDGRSRHMRTVEGAMEECRDTDDYKNYVAHTECGNVRRLCKKDTCEDILRYHWPDDPYMREKDHAIRWCQEDEGRKAEYDKRDQNTQCGSISAICDSVFASDLISKDRDYYFEFDGKYALGRTNKVVREDLNHRLRFTHSRLAIWYAYHDKMPRYQYLTPTGDGSKVTTVDSKEQAWLATYFRSDKTGWENHGRIAWVKDGKYYYFNANDYTTTPDFGQGTRFVTKDPYHLPQRIGEFLVYPKGVTEHKYGRQYVGFARYNADGRKEPMVHLNHIQPYGCDPSDRTGGTTRGCEGGDYKGGRENKEHWLVFPKILQARVWNSGGYPGWNSGYKLRNGNQSSGVDVEKARGWLMDKMGWGSWPHDYEFAYFKKDQDYWGLEFR
nr:hypothetical protein TetV2_00589 [Oceanusvirus sp.]